MKRREVLKGGLFLGAQGLLPVDRLLGAIVGDLIRKAEAQAAGAIAAPKNYLSLSLYRAPLRFVFDAWLNTNPEERSSRYAFNPMTATRFTSSNGRVDGVAHDTFAYRGLNVPPLFQSSVKNGEGRDVPLTKLLDHMLVIRGFSSGMDGHPQNLILQQQPVGGLPSISGFVADGSNRAFGAIRWPGHGHSVYASATGRGLNNPGGSDPLQRLFGPVARDSQARALRGRHVAAIDLAKERLKHFASGQSKAAKIARDNMKGAMDMIKAGVGGLDAYWSEAVPRYQRVVEAGLRQRIDGVNDKPIIADGSKKFAIMFSDGRIHVPPAGADILSYVLELKTSSIAEGLAFAEYVYVNGLATAVETATGHFENLQIGGKSELADKDMHETGLYPSILLSTMYFAGISAGLVELIGRLEAAPGRSGGKTAWNETVIHLFSEFNRSCRADGTGSDHGFKQMVSSVISGAFASGPEVVGNISTAGPESGYEGLQGVAAPVDGYLGGAVPGPATMASTVAEIVHSGGANPWANATPPLVRLAGGRVVPAFGRGKIKE